jgi:penicillin amidase
MGWKSSVREPRRSWSGIVLINPVQEVYIYGPEGGDMNSFDATRRAFLAAVVGGAAVGGTQPPASDYLDRLAPLSGSAWEAAKRDVPDEVDSPFGPAELRYDDARVPHVEAQSDRALYYAVGYAQATDRLFQMDLFRRRMRGTLSAVLGERTVESDVFHAQMDFAAAPEASWSHLQGSETGEAVAAYVDGVNAAREELGLPLEFELVGYEPEPWEPADTLLLEEQISWGLTGSFRTLRQAVLREELGDLHGELYPERMDHDSPIIRQGETGGEVTASREWAGEAAGAAVGTDLVDWLSGFESPPGIGSNSWVVSGEHTASGEPLVANDPHLTLLVPPIWYQQDLRTPEMEVRGVTFPGVPFVVIGANHAGAWGFTNTGADVIDFYEYETRKGQYRYEGEWRDYDEETRTVAVSGGDDREVTVRKTVHGPVVEREGQQVAVAWTGLTATETTTAIHEYAHSDGVEDVVAATRSFDLPTQNLVYADRDGNTLYYVTGRIPDRRVNGKQVRGDRVFDGSAGEAEWEGFTPYGESSWEGFVPFEEKPHVRNPDVLGTANQRVVDDPTHYLGEAFAPPFRGARLYDRLDGAVESGDDIDAEFTRELQQDTYDRRADHLVPVVLDAESEVPASASDLLDALRKWDHRMTRDSRAALAFDRFLHHYRERLFADAFEQRGLDEGYWPSDWVVCTLDADSPWFDELGESRQAVVAGALADATAEIEAEDWETYGDVNVLDVNHPFELDVLGYPERPTDGSAASLKNFRRDSPAGSSWRMVAAPGEADGDGAAWGVIPGGNSGDYFSDSYADQLDAWATGGYRRLGQVPDGDADVTFEAGGDR